MVRNGLKNARGFAQLLSLTLFSLGALAIGIGYPSFTVYQILHGYDFYGWDGNEIAGVIIFNFYALIFLVGGSVMTIGMLSIWRDVFRHFTNFSNNGATTS